MKVPWDKVQTYLGYGLFWTWNLIFLVVVLFGLLPHVLLSLIGGVIDGEVPLSMALGSMLVCLIPLVSVGIGARYFRRDPKALLTFFYGVEAPFLLTILMRIFLVRELPPGLMLLIAVISISLVSYGYALATGHGKEEAPLAEGGKGVLQMSGHTVAFFACIYAGSLIAFYAPPLAFSLLKAFFSFHWLEGLFNGLRYARGPEIFLVPLAMLLFAYTLSLFVAMPVALVVLYYKTFRKAATRFVSRHGRPALVALCSSLAAVLILSFVAANRQPQRKVFALLETPPKDDAARRALLEKSEFLREGLVNAHLAPYRYLGALGSNDHIQEIYYDVFGLPKKAGRTLQVLHNALARPVLYDGDSLHGDMHRSSEHYEAFFDTPLQKGERTAYRKALSATHDRRQREASLLDADERKVFVAEQELTVKALSGGALAEVELHEVYENQTTQQQEIFYYFTLPESAAVTGLWLADGDRKDLRYPFVVAPRGAAQKVYNAEVRKRRDPALLEQIGPRQYRLRAFPIPPRQRVGDLGRDGAGAALVEKAQAFHLWMTYRVLQQPGSVAGSPVPLPILRERRNAYFTSSTKRTYPPGTVSGKVDDWLPASVPAAQSAAQGNKRATFPVPKELAPLSQEGADLQSANYVLQATPYTPKQVTQTGDAAFAEGKSFAVVLDRSYSMGVHRGAVVQTFQVLRQVFAKAHVDLYLTAGKSRGEEAVLLPGTGLGLPAFDPASVVYYGGQKGSTALTQFDSLRKDRTYAAILVLTDQGSLDLADDKVPPKDLGARVLMVHLGAQLAALPPGYDDATLETIQRRGGGSFVGIGEALSYLQVAEEKGPAFRGVDRGYLFEVVPAPSGEAAASVDLDVSPILVRQLTKQVALDLDLQSERRLAQLDALHKMAKTHAVVTPYSSMLVLVDEAQREALRKASEAKDRFQRDVESGNANLIPPGDLGRVTGAPEPGQWALLLSALFALFVWHRRRYA